MAPVSRRRQRFLRLQPATSGNRFVINTYDEVIQLATITRADAKQGQVTTYPLFIGGEWVDTGRYTKVADKYTGEVFAHVAEAGREEVDRAVAVAAKVWKQQPLTPYQRFEILSRAAEIWRSRREEFALALSREAGKIMREALTEVDRVADIFLISAEEAKRIKGEMIPVGATPGSENRLGFTLRVPVGVVCAISPFNFPSLLTAHKVGPALAAGNSVVLKPASTTPLQSVFMCQVLEEAGLPAGYLNLVVGGGSTVGEWLLQDKRFNFFTFTGSSGIGERIKAVTGLRRCKLELGSNAATIVHSDADLKQAAKLCALKAFNFAGQVCISVQRILVQQDVVEEFTRLLVAETAKFKLGNPLDTATDIGPMISEKEAARVEAWVAEAVEQGARIAHGGKRDGVMHEPTILVDVRQEMKVVCQEVFGPIVSLLSYETIDQAIALANDSEFGLQGGVFTMNVDTAFKVAREFEVGGVMINDASSFRVDQMPYGGVKNSGIGREGPRFAIEEMTEMKLVMFNL